jgi:hypothetical protein
VTQKTPANSRFSDPLAILVASGSTIKDAAASAGCSLPIAYSLSRSPEFKSMVSTIRSEAIRQAIGTLSLATTRAAETLVALLADDDPKIRLAAVARLFASIAPLTELHELRTDIEELRSQMSPNLKVAQ